MRTRHYLGHISYLLGNFRDAEREFRQTEALCERGKLGMDCSLVMLNASKYYAAHKKKPQAGVLKKLARKVSIKRWI